MRFLSTFMVLAMCSAHSPLWAQVYVPVDDRQALIDLYHATDGDNWFDNEGWLGERGTECSWRGVRCACGFCTIGSETFVNGLNLSNNNLIGTLPDSLRNLFILLGTFDLSQNQLSGSLPDDVWGIKDAGSFDLSDNRFSGVLPFAILDVGPGDIDLSNNRFTEFGPGERDDSDAFSVRYIDLPGNRLTTFPPPSWLDPGIDFGLEGIDLSSNEFAGVIEIDQEIPSRLHRLQLADNRIEAIQGLSGTSFPKLEELDLSNNRLEQWPLCGFFPALKTLLMPNNFLRTAWPEADPGFVRLDELVLRNNRIEGFLPEWFDDLEIESIDLDNNSIEGSLRPLFAALVDEPSDSVRLYAANNLLSGNLPIWFDFDNFEEPFSEPHLDLCGNRLPLGNAELVNKANLYQRGGDLVACQLTQRHPMGLEMSGSWFDPTRSGEGITQMLLDNGVVLSYWFTYPPSGWIRPSPEVQIDQAWFFGVSRPNGSGYRIHPMLRTKGRFGAGLDELRGDIPWIDWQQVGQDAAQFFYSGVGFFTTDVAGYLEELVIDDRYLRYARLSQLAGTNCQNQAAHQWISGAWYDPDRDGEGFIVEAVGADRAIVYWFTYAAEGAPRQAWMTGDGRFVDNTIHIDALYRPIGAAFGEDFDPADVDLNHWGSLIIEFDDDLSGTVAFGSIDPNYASGSFPISRLARPMLADCTNN